MIQSESHYDNRYSLKSNYTYDHAAREKSSTYALGYGATRHTSPLRTFNYDSYGRVIEKQLQGDKVAVMYNYQNDGTLYNIISTSRFNETLYYGNSMLPYQLSRCYNGNIADISISQDGRSYFYHFDYDEFNRLTSGMMYGMSGSRLKNDEFYSYDKMGNITSLYRLEEAPMTTKVFMALMISPFIPILLIANKSIIMMVMAMKQLILIRILWQYAIISLIYRIRYNLVMATVS